MKGRAHVPGYNYKPPRYVKSVPSISFPPKISYCSIGQPVDLIPLSSCTYMDTPRPAGPRRRHWLASTGGIVRSILVLDSNTGPGCSQYTLAAHLAVGGGDSSSRAHSCARLANFDTESESESHRRDRVAPNPPHEHATTSAARLRANSLRD